MTLLVTPIKLGTKRHTRSLPYYQHGSDFKVSQATALGRSLLNITQHEGPSLLIGSSLIKDIDAAELEDTKVVSLPGGHIDDVTEYMTKTDIKFKSVTLVVGGNDCAARTDPEPVAELVQKCSDMTKEAKRLADDILVSTVIPRITDTENVSEEIDAMNAGLVSMCHSENYTIINIDNFFK